MEQDNTNVTLQDSTSEVDERVIVITRMRVTDIAASLRRIPAGFYASILIGDEEYRTTNKRVSLDSGTIEWTDHFRLPGKTSTTIDLRIHASFELGPMLGRGELLRRVCISVEDLIDHSNSARPIAFLCEQERSCVEVHVGQLSPVDLRSVVLSPPVAVGSPLERNMSHDTDLGHSYMLRYYQDREESLLEDAISQYESVIDRCPEDHFYRSAALSNLALAELVSCEERGAYPDLDIPIALYRDVLHLRPNGHPDHGFALINLANALLFRFHTTGSNADADEAEELLTTILDIYPVDSDKHRSALLMVQRVAMREVDEVVNSSFATPGSSSANLGVAYSLHQFVDMLRQCQQRDDPQLLDDTISGFHQAEAYYVAGQPDWIALQITVAMALDMRFKRRGRKQDVDEAIKRNQDVLLWTARGHPLRAHLLSNLADALKTRFERWGDSSDLEETVQHYRDALSLTPIDHPDRSMSLNNLANALKTRFQQRGDSSDLDEAVEHHRDALSLRPIGHPDHSTSLNNLANALTTRFEQRGDGRDLDEAVQHYRDALSLTPIDHRDRAISLNNLANALLTRFQQRGDSTDLDEAIQHHRDALSLTPIGHPPRSRYLNNLAGALTTRFEQRGDAADLDEAVQHHRDALLLIPIGHPLRSGSLNNLARALTTRFEQRGDVRDLDEAVQHHRDALSLTPIGHPLRSMFLNNLANALQTQFEQRGDDSDLDQAIEHHRDALSLTPNGHPLRSGSLNNLAGALTTRFEQRGNSSDLDEAVQHHQDALSLTPIGHPDRSMSLNNLAGALTRRFEQRGDGRDLDEAVQHHRDALLLTPIGHPLRSGSLNNLAGALTRRFEQRGDDNDLDEAVQYHRDALSLTPVGHPDRPSGLNNLANALMRWFEQRGDGRDLDEAVQHHRDALSLTPVGHPDHSGSLNNLASALTTQFEQRGDGSVLDEAVQHHRDAVSLTPVGHLNRSMSLNNLAGALARRFEHHANGEDADEALQLCHVAEAQTPSGHPIQLSICRVSANIYLALWEKTCVETHVHNAMASFKVAADIETAGLLPRLQSCLLWVKHGERHGHESTLEAYTRAITLFDIHLSATASVSVRHVTMKQFPRSLAVDAASCALHHGDVPRALELLEQGRAVLWNQMIRFRTSLDDLRSRDVHAEMLVRRFQELSFQLSKQPTDEPSSRGMSRATIDDEARRYRGLVDQWHEVVAEIRTLDGFSRFLLPPLFSDLQQAACEGPVIVLVASQFSCDAIIVLHDRPPIHIVLDTTLQQLEDLAYPLWQETFYSSESTPGRSSINNVLRHLWDTVMSPVMSKLEEFVEHDSRIWWCPTSIFTAFPLHAVGVSGRESVVGMYISSYTPSLSALIKARKDRQVSLPVHFAAIGQALPDGRNQPLLSVDQELQEIEGLLPSTSTVFTKLTGSASTRDEAHGALRNNPWVHFACHGTQNFKEPFKSCLSMRDGPLSLLDIINTDLSKHEFAFLSACETAVGDFESMDEAIHLAAGLQFMGVKSVIGTLWIVPDDIALRMSSKFYNEFCSGDKMDPTRAARALHEAYMSLAREKVPLDQRIMFIHIGI